MNRRAVKHSAVLQSKSRIVIRTNDTATDEFAVCQGTAEVRARLRNGKQAIAAPNQENRHIVVYSSSRLVVHQL